MICHHCPGKQFGSESELQAHLDEHENIQLRLRRHGNRTYGSRLAQKEKQIPQGGPILPTTNATTTTTTVGTPPAPGVATADGDDPHGNLANVMRHDASYLIFRRFAAMNIRNILRIQSELAHLEKRLEEEGDVTGRLQYLVETRLLAYNEAMARYSQICRLGAPDPVALSDLRRWAQSSLPQSNSPDLAFLSKPELGDHDLVTLGEGSSQKTWVYRLVETLAWRWLSTKTLGGRTVSVSQSGRLHLYDDAKVRLIVRVLLTVVSSALLLVPVGILSRIEDRPTVVVVVALCCILVSVVMAAGTACRDHEIVLAACAYAAVLIVFAQK